MMIVRVGHGTCWRFLFVDWKTFVKEPPVDLFDLLSHFELVDSFEHFFNITVVALLNFTLAWRETGYFLC